MNWRPISEKPLLDEEGHGDMVLTWVSDGMSYRGYYKCQDHQEGWFSDCGIRIYPTHWCEITPPAEPVPQGYAEITIGGVKTLAKMDTTSSLVVEHHVSGGTLMMVADDLAALRRDAEFPRLLAWIKDPNRKSPELAFTSGDARTIADLFVMHQRDADRWRKFVAKMNDDVMAPPVDAMVEAVDALPDPAP